MRRWVTKWVGECVNGQWEIGTWMGEWTGEWVDEQPGEGVGERLKDQVSQCMKERRQMVECTGG